jgi:hypothetical protein
VADISANLHVATIYSDNCQTQYHPKRSQKNMAEDNSRTGGRHFLFGSVAVMASIRYSGTDGATLVAGTTQKHLLATNGSNESSDVHANTVQFYLPSGPLRGTSLAKTGTVYPFADVDPAIADEATFAVSVMNGIGVVGFDGADPGTIHPASAHTETNGAPHAVRAQQCPCREICGAYFGLTATNGRMGHGPLYVIPPHPQTTLFPSKDRNHGPKNATLLLLPLTHETMRTYREKILAKCRETTIPPSTLPNCTLADVAPYCLKTAAGFLYQGAEHVIRARRRDSAEEIMQYMFTLPAFVTPLFPQMGHGTGFVNPTSCDIISFVGVNKRAATASPCSRLLGVPNTSVDVMCTVNPTCRMLRGLPIPDAGALIVYGLSRDDMGIFGAYHGAVPFADVWDNRQHFFRVLFSDLVAIVLHDVAEQKRRYAQLMEYGTSLNVLTAMERFVLSYLLMNRMNMFGVEAQDSTRRHGQATVVVKGFSRVQVCMPLTVPFMTSGVCRLPITTAERRLTDTWARLHMCDPANPQSLPTNDTHVIPYYTATIGSPSLFGDIGKDLYKPPHEDGERDANDVFRVLEKRVFTRYRHLSLSHEFFDMPTEDREQLANHLFDNSLTAQSVSFGCTARFMSGYACEDSVTIERRLSAVQQTQRSISPNDKRHLRDIGGVIF